MTALFEVEGLNKVAGSTHARQDHVRKGQRIETMQIPGFIATTLPLQCRILWEVLCLGFCSS